LRQGEIPSEPSENIVVKKKGKRRKMMKPRRAEVYFSKNL